MTLKPKITIGLPVYNGEKFIRNSLDSILSQTFTDFELIISDNASTDSTPKICEEYAKKDKRIRYIHQTKNMGLYWNFYFLNRESKCEYFVWLAADDFWLPQYLEKNIAMLESDKNIVGSMSKIKYYGKFKTFEVTSTDSVFIKIYKKIRQHFRSYGIISLYGSYPERARKFLHKGTGAMMYAVYRTDKLQIAMDVVQQNGMVQNYIDSVAILSILKYGNLHALDEFLFNRYTGGISSKGYVHENMEQKSIFNLIFPWYPITFWCIKNLGMKFFLKNIDYFGWYAIWGPVSFMIEMGQILREKILKK